MLNMWYSLCMAGEDTINRIGPESAVQACTVNCHLRGHFQVPLQVAKSSSVQDVHQVCVSAGRPCLGFSWGKSVRSWKQVMQQMQLLHL